VAVCRLPPDWLMLRGRVMRLQRQIVRMRRFNRNRESARENLPHLGDPPKSLREKKERPGGRSVGGAIAVPVLRRRVLTGVQPGLRLHAFQDRWFGVYFSYARGASLSRLGGSTTLMAATP